MPNVYTDHYRQLTEALAPYGFANGKYGDLLYKAVAWNGITDRVAFGFNIFVDDRLIATAEFLKNGQMNISMQLGQWLTDTRQWPD